jgi:hypothetical protein
VGISPQWSGALRLCRSAPRRPGHASSDFIKFCSLTAKTRPCHHGNFVDELAGCLSRNETEDTEDDDSLSKEALVSITQNPYSW